MSHCRDCKWCTRLAIVKLLLYVPRVLGTLLFRWNIGLFIRYCPECGHRLSGHARRKDGSFKD